MKPLSRYIDAKNVENLQINQYANVLRINGTVPAIDNQNGALTAVLNISSYGGFLMQSFTGKYSTLVSDGGQPAAAVDDGTNHLSVKIVDVTSAIDLFDDFVPLDLFLSPGRVRTPGVYVDAAGGVPNPSNQLFWPMPFEYYFSSNAEINLEFRNNSDWSNTFDISFWGIRLKSSISVRRK